jgi:hypothetical protein
VARRNVIEGWPRYDGKVGSAVADGCEARRVRLSRCGGSAAETRFPWRARP